MTAYATGSELAGWLRIDEDADLAMVTESASRAIDRACGRTFGTTEPETRTFEAQYLTGRGRSLVSFDDISTTDDLIFEIDGAVIDSYVLLPLNSAQKGRPWTHAQIPGVVRGLVDITARWGFGVPEAIILATLTQAARWLQRRDNPGGPMTVKEVDDVRYGWASSTATTDLDAEVLAMIAPYRRRWFVA